jgi:hypothetical protein
MEYHETVWHRRYLQTLCHRGNLDCLANGILSEYLAWFYIQILAMGIITDCLERVTLAQSLALELHTTCVCMGYFQIDWHRDTYRSLPQWILGYILTTSYIYTPRMFDIGYNYGLFGREVIYNLFVTRDSYKPFGKRG